jgi:ribonuclease HII
MQLTEFDRRFRESGYPLLCGVDEAGRGPLAGPVYAAAVILPPGLEIGGLNDSKKLTEKKREALFDSITRGAASYHIASASEKEIDELNIRGASLLAMRRAVAGLAGQPDLALVDGNRNPLLGMETALIVKGDGKSASIAAASVLAKVARDRYMLELDARYPAYGFAKHKGYPTKLHYEMLDAHGESPVHRKTFLRGWRSARDEGIKAYPQGKKGRGLHGGASAQPGDAASGAELSQPLRRG